VNRGGRRGAVRLTSRAGRVGGPVLAAGCRRERGEHGNAAMGR
jgi:hypothetical protein